MRRYDGGGVMGSMILRRYGDFGGIWEIDWVRAPRSRRTIIFNNFPQYFE
jgi:hypothetical protein